MTKKLFVLIADGGDGSYSPQYTFNEEWINDKQVLFDAGEYEYPEPGCDGDGFNYRILTVPDECTLKSLGIHYDCAKR